MSEMSEYPKKTCEIEKLIQSPKLMTKAIEGMQTQQRRNGVYGYPAEKFTLKGTQFIITDLREQRLGEMTNEDAIKEGYKSLDDYKDFILGMHHGMEWDPEAVVWVHSFRKA